MSPTLADDGRRVAGIVVWLWMGGALLIVSLLSSFMIVAINRGMPWAICARLVRRRRPISYRTTYSGGVWNPAKPLGRGNATHNRPGRATYVLTGDNQVQLDIAYDDGRHEHFIGPAVDRPGNARRLRHAGLAPVLVYLTMIAAGFPIGYLASTGPTGHRFEYGLLAALAGYIVAWLALTVAAGIWSRRLTRTPTADR